MRPAEPAIFVWMYCLLSMVGAESLTFQKIDSLNTYYHELAEGMPVIVTFTVTWYEWDGKDGEGQKTDGSHSKMKAARLEKVSFNYRNLSQVLTCLQIYLFNIFD